MRVLTIAVPMFLLAAAPGVQAASLFDGTWRPDPQRAEPGRKPDVYRLVNGEFECQSCTPPYKVKADGMDHPVSGNPRFDTLNVKVVDERTTMRVARKGGAPVFETKDEVSADGATLTVRQILFDAGARKIDFTSRSSRVAAGPPGAPRITGSWQFVEADLTNHDEDTRLQIANGELTMSDHMGRSFTAKLDGSDAPYRGDPQFTSVSVKLLDERTLEESDKNAGKVVKITRWTVDPDGKTIHATFDDTHGHVEHQSGRKLNPSLSRP